MTTLATPDAAAAAAKECAARLRRDFQVSAQEPVPLKQLLAIARHRAIVRVRFNVPLASAGLLEYRPGAGFEASIANGPAGRGRYTLAHEIGHTFFSSHATQANVNFSDTVPLFEAASRALEESFCEKFASELLLPTDATRIQLSAVADIRSANEFLSILERVSSKFSVSIRMLLIRAYEAGVWPGTLLVAVLDARWHRRKASEEAVDIVAAYTDRKSGWYLPNRQYARDAGLSAGIALTRAWDELARRGDHQGLSTGAFQIASDGTLCRLNETERTGQPVVEELHLKRKEDDGMWSRRTIDVPILYRLYASSASDAYVLAIAHLDAAVRSSQANVTRR